MNNKKKKKVIEEGEVINSSYPPRVHAHGSNVCIELKIRYIFPMSEFDFIIFFFSIFITRVKLIRLSRIERVFNLKFRFSTNCKNIINLYNQNIIIRNNRKLHLYNMGR